MDKLVKNSKLVTHRQKNFSRTLLCKWSTEKRVSDSRDTRL